MDVNKELCVTVAELRLILTVETAEGAIYAVESGRAKKSNSDDVERMTHPDLARDIQLTLHATSHVPIVSIRVPSLLKVPANWRR